MSLSDFPAISRLPLDEKIQLVEELWDEIAAEETSIPVPQDHKDELDRRLSEYQASGLTAEQLPTWEQVKEGLLRDRG